MTDREPPNFTASPSRESSPPVIDWPQALETAFGDAELLREIATTCLEEMPAVLAQMRTALDANVTKAFSRGAHTLKGHMRIFAADAAEQAAAQLEKLALAGDPCLSEPFALLQQQLALVDHELREFLAGRVTTSH